MSNKHRDAGCNSVGNSTAGMLVCWNESITATPKTASSTYILHKCYIWIPTLCWSHGSGSKGVTLLYEYNLLCYGPSLSLFLNRWRNNFLTDNSKFLFFSQPMLSKIFFTCLQSSISHCFFMFIFNVPQPIRWQKNTQEYLIIVKVKDWFQRFVLVSFTVAFWIILFQLQKYILYISPSSFSQLSSVPK